MRKCWPMEKHIMIYSVSVVMVITAKEMDILFTSGLFPAKPTSLVEPYVQSKPDGEIFYVITYGSISGLMGPHGAQIQPDDRWSIISYVRELAN